MKPNNLSIDSALLNCGICNEMKIEQLVKLLYFVKEEVFSIYLEPSVLADSPMSFCLRYAYLHMIYPISFLEIALKEDSKL